MTVFEKNLCEAEYQPGLFTNVNRPEDEIDLSWITPDMMDSIVYDKSSRSVDFWFKTYGLFCPYISIYVDGDIAGADLNIIPGHEDTPKMIQSFASSLFTGPAPMGSNVKLPEWMHREARKLRRKYDAV